MAKLKALAVTPAFALLALALGGIVLVSGGCGEDSSSIETSEIKNDETNPVASTPPALSEAGPYAYTCRDDSLCSRLNGLTGACETARCVRGTCMIVPRAFGTECSVGGKCMARGICSDGLCTAGARDCRDDNPCTTDYCDELVGCVNAFNTDPCDDGDACTVGDRCEAGFCKSGEPMDCSDDDLCTGFELCEDGECVSAGAPECGDGFLQPGCGEECDDGNLVSGDGCDKGCQAEDKVCATSKDCDDGNPCTDDVCDPFVGCTHAPNSGAICEDDDPCTNADYCVDGECQPGGPTQCDDGVDCTEDYCEPGLGCIHTPSADACGEASACNGYVCDPTEGCVEVADTAGGWCTPDDLCAYTGVCIEGACESLGEKVCNDGNDCTEDSCDAGVGCVYTALNGVACDDGDACTQADACVAGECSPGIAVEKPGCGDTPYETLCSLTGAQGQEVTCDLQLVRPTDDSVVATGLQLNLAYDAQSVSLVNWYDSLCFDFVGCFDVGVAFAEEGAFFSISSGHSVTLAPSTASGWNATPCDSAADCGPGGTCTDELCDDTGGFGGALVINFSDPTTPITDAYFDGDTIVGDPVVAEIRFALLRDADEGNPVVIQVGAVEGANSDSTTLDVDVVDGVLVSE